MAQILRCWGAAPRVKWSPTVNCHDEYYCWRHSRLARTENVFIGYSMRYVGAAMPAARFGYLYLFVDTITRIIRRLEVDLQSTSPTARQRSTTTVTAVTQGNKIGNEVAMIRA